MEQERVFLPYNKIYSETITSGRASYISKGINNVLQTVEGDLYRQETIPAIFIRIKSEIKRNRSIIKALSQIQLPKFLPVGLYEQRNPNARSQYTVSLDIYDTVLATMRFDPGIQGPNEVWLLCRGTDISSVRSVLHGTYECNRIYLASIDRKGRLNPYPISLQASYAWSELFPRLTGRLDISLFDVVPIV